MYEYAKSMSSKVSSRELLYKRGSSSLSDVALLEVIVNSGTVNKQFY